MTAENSESNGMQYYETWIQNDDMWRCIGMTYDDIDISHSPSPIFDVCVVTTKPILRDLSNSRLHFDGFRLDGYTSLDAYEPDIVYTFSDIELDLRDGVRERDSVMVDCVFEVRPCDSDQYIY